MMKILLLVAMLVSCGTKSADPSPADGNSMVSDGHGTVTDGAGGTDTSPYVCTPLSVIACCVFDPNACSTWPQGQTSCQFSSSYDSPSQGAGDCKQPSSLPVGAVCPVTALTAGPNCIKSAWCEFDANSPTTYQGICRLLCDPLDLADHGCPANTTCIGMLHCDNPADYPNCPPATNVHLGYCK
jgi:hypothetical protein